MTQNSVVVHATYLKMQSAKYFKLRLFLGNKCKISAG